MSPTRFLCATELVSDPGDLGLYIKLFIEGRAARLGTHLASHVAWHMALTLTDKNP